MRFDSEVMRWLLSRPVLASGQADDLVIEVDNVLPGERPAGAVAGVRVWVSRTGRADGEPYNSNVSVEVLTNGRWETLPEGAASARQVTKLAFVKAGYSGGGLD